MTKLQRSALTAGIVILAVFATASPHAPHLASSEAGLPLAGAAALAVGLLELKVRRGSRRI